MTYTFAREWIIPLALVLALLALLALLLPTAAHSLPCRPYPGNGPADGIPDDQDSCFVVWDRNTPMSSSPMSLSMDGGSLAVRICDLLEPAINDSTPWCPEQSGAQMITLGEWCRRLRILPLPAGGTEAMRAVLVEAVCSPYGA